MTAIRDFLKQRNSRQGHPPPSTKSMTRFQEGHIQQPTNNFLKDSLIETGKQYSHPPPRTTKKNKNTKTMKQEHD
jgi:hypothetical protein